MKSFVGMSILLSCFLAICFPVDAVLSTKKLHEIIKLHRKYPQASFQAPFCIFHIVKDACCVLMKFQLISVFVMSFPITITVYFPGVSA